jgi:serine/threonine-protein kinase RsbW
MAKKISKTILSRTDHLLEVREFVSEAARQFGFSEEDVANIVLAVDEACTNIIKHHRRGGLGVYLMKKLMDKVEYNFAAGDKNEVSLVKYLSRKQAPAKK